MLKNIVVHLMQHESNGMIYFESICSKFVHRCKQRFVMYLICLNTMFHF